MLTPHASGKPRLFRVALVMFLGLNTLLHPLMPLAQASTTNSESHRWAPFISYTGMKLLERELLTFNNESIDGAGGLKNAGQASQADGCPTSGTPSEPAPSRVIYMGQTSVACNASLPVSGQLTDSCGNALPDRRLVFTFAGQSVEAVTDSNGIARSTMTPPAGFDNAPMTVNYVGDESHTSAQDSTTVKVNRVGTSLSYTGKALIATGTSESVTAVLTDTADRRPIPSASVSFEVGSVRASATTDVNGVARANISLPTAETLEHAQLKISFAGNSCYDPASTTGEVTTYFRTAFVVWGGNSRGLSLGQRINFWGHSWAKQVTGGDYQAHNDFKGYADNISQFRLCQVNARTDGTPRLDDSCWSSKPGQSFPPQTLPTHIGVIVTNSMDKSGARDLGNIAAMVVLKVDPQPAYGAVPGKPGFGVIVDVIEDGANISRSAPALEATQTQPANVLPGQSFAVALNLSNRGGTDATNVSISETFANAIPLSATVEAGTLSVGSTQQRSFQTTTAALPVRGDDESNVDYQRRLGAFDGTLFSSIGVVNYIDPSRRVYPGIAVSSTSQLRLPRLTVGISAPLCVTPGATIPYILKISNIGSAVSTSATALVRFPDGTSTEILISSLEPGKSYSSAVNWKAPSIGLKGATELNADYLARLASFDGKALSVSVSITWKDALGNDYGVVEQQCSSIQRVPILSQTAQAIAPMLPAQRLPLSAAVRNTGGGNAFQSRLRVTNPDASVYDTQSFNLAAGNSTTAPVTLNAPSVTAKQAEETDAAYLARLQAADNRPIEFVLALEWNDAAGNTYGPLTTTLSTTEVLPIVVIELTTQETAQAGDTIVYTARGNNIGHAEARDIEMAITLPGGAVQQLQLENNVLPAAGNLQQAVNFTVPAAQVDGRINALSTVNWKDANTNRYGSLSATAVTNIVNPNQPPTVNAGLDQTVKLSETVSLNGSAGDDGKPSGSALTVTWSRVSGPGIVSFGNPQQALTTATFSVEGSYVLRLTASDSLLSASDEATVNVVSPPAAPAYSETVKPDAGESVNLDLDEYNHLHVSNETRPFNFIWVAVSSKGTIVKIDTDTGKVLGEYFSSPAGQPKDPSRTTVDHNGSVWASNRAGNSVLRIGLAENGQCTDRNGNGVIDTSTGAGDIRAWPNTNSVDTDGGVETAQDECVINYTRVRSSGTRHVSVNAANDVWVSGTGGRFFDLIDGQTGLIKRQEPSAGYGGYGGLIDKNGVIWSSRNLLRWDTALPLKGANGGNWKGWTHDSYGLCIDSKGNVWNTALDGNLIHKFAPEGTLLGTYQHGDHWAQGCVVDKNDDVWVAHSLHRQTVGHLKNDGTWVGNVTVGNGPTGVAVDAKGKIWATNHNSRTVSRIDPDAGPIGTDEVTRVGAVDLTTVNLGGTLYNYSDMTGSTLSGTPSGGTWSHVFDSGKEGAEWGVVGWNGRVCGDGALVVTAASSADGVQFSAPVEATNTADINVPNGRYLKVVVRFRRSSSGESPFLYDLSVGTKGFTVPPSANLPPSVDAGPDQTATMPNPASLIGSVCDTGQLLGPLSVTWEKVSGPGTATFSNANVPGTSASFSEAGEYVLRLNASDSNLSASDEVTVLVHPFNDAPVVSAGADQSLILPTTLSLNGVVTDDALPAGSSVSTSWSKISGPGEVSFVNVNAATTAAAFSESGTYVLRLIAQDSQLANVDDVTVKVYPPNRSPSVNAGEDRILRLPAKANLSGAVNDDGLPLGKTTTVAWTKVSGPGAVTFGKASAAETTAAFSQPGTYVLRLTANDSQLSSSDELTLTVNPANQPPSVNAGADLSVTLPDSASLSATIADDGLPEESAVTLTWSKVSGPGLVNFSNPGASNTSAAFTQAGTYILRLTASDSALSRSDDVTVMVNPNTVNLPPTVGAGVDQTITLPAKATLSGLAGDDRLPSGSTLSSSWSKVSGPGAVTFANAGAAVTTAAFSSAGEYVLRLTARDTELESGDDVNITVLPVNQPPVVKAGADQIISFPNSANLNGTAADDGLPSGHTLSIFWSKVSGPGTVAFANADTAATSATFSHSGIYVLRLTASDAQHSRSDDVSISVNRAPVVEAGADQTIHLPGSARLRGTVTDDALPAGKIIQLAWSKLSGPGTVTFSPATATTTTATFSETGTYVLGLNASDTLLTDRDELSVTVNPPLPPPPALAISSPTESAEITSRFDVIGSVSNGNWKLEYSLGPDTVSPNNNVWTTIASGTTPVANAALGTFDPTLLLNGTYAIRLTATDNSGQTTSIIKNTIVAGDQKVGNFTVSFEDLDILLAGLPIQLVRTYDSRDKRVGDFGIGWSLNINSIRLEKSAELGKYWRESVLPGIVPQYCVQPSRPNIITITFPDGKVYKFQATTAKQCQAAAPITFARFGFTAMPGTKGTLVPEAPTDIYVEGSIPGPVELLDAADPLLGIYNPTLFRFTDEQGFSYLIDQKQGVRSVTDPHGNKLTISRDGVIHSGGKKVSFIRDPQGRITQIVDPRGNALTYAYDAGGDLTGVTDQENNTVRFDYNSTHGLIRIRDPRGVSAVRNEYDDRGRLIATVDASDRRVEFTHDTDARREAVRDRIGHLTVYEYDASGNVLRLVDPLGGITGFTYNNKGHKLTETNALGKTTVYTYDVNGNVLSETNASGEKTSFTYNARGQETTETDPRGLVTTNTYDSRGNLLSMRDPTGNVLTLTYDAKGNQTSLRDSLGNGFTSVYDASGHLLRQTNSSGVVTEYTYDANGNRLTETLSYPDAGGQPVVRTTTYTYDRLNRLIQVLDPAGNTTLTQYNEIGQELFTIDANGGKTQYEYNDRGELTKTIFPDASTVTTSYDANGRSVGVTDKAGRTARAEYDALGRVTRKISADGSSVRSEYDAASRMVAIFDEKGNKTTLVHDATGRTTAAIDPLGNQTTFAYDSAGNQLSITDARGHTTKFEYDANGRRTKIISHEGTFQQVAHDTLGRIVSETDQAGNVRRIEYNAQGRPFKLINAAGLATTVSYDAMGNMTAYTDTAGRITRWEYDALGRPLRRTLPLGMSETFTYDRNGNVVSRTDFNGRSIRYSYDAANRPTTKTYLDGKQTTYTYNASGLRETMMDDTGRTSYTYDAKNRLISVENPEGNTVSYTYDAKGNPTSLTVPSGTTTYTYDELDRLKTVADPQQRVTSYKYDAVGNRESVQYPNGSVTQYGYDALNRLIELENKRSDNSLISGYTYTLGANGNRLSVAENTGRRINYSYDSLSRLTREEAIDPASGAKNYSYTYDSVGNRLSKTIDGLMTSYTYDDNDRLLTEGAATYTYDANGNTLSRVEGNTTTTYSYNFDNMLTGVSRPGQTNTYAYDGDGVRVKSSINGVATNYTVDRNRALSQVLEERSSANTLQASYTYGAELINMNRGGATSYYHYDGLGSTRHLSDNSGNLTASYNYEAFGALVASTGETENKRLFTGEEHEPDSGLYFLRARFYNPAAGRFISADPFPGNLMEPMSVHKYVYANADPVNNTDPSGLLTLSNVLTALGNLMRLSASLYRATEKAFGFIEQFRTLQDLVKLVKFAHAMVTNPTLPLAAIFADLAGGPLSEIAKPSFWYKKVFPSLAANSFEILKQILAQPQKQAHILRVFKQAGSEILIYMPSPDPKSALGNPIKYVATPFSVRGKKVQFFFGSEGLRGRITGLGLRPATNNKTTHNQIFRMDYHLQTAHRTATGAWTMGKTDYASWPCIIYPNEFHYHIPMKP